MRSHELAAMLLASPDLEVVMSVHDPEGGYRDVMDVPLREVVWSDSVELREGEPSEEEKAESARLQAIIRREAAEARERQRIADEAAQEVDF